MTTSDLTAQGLRFAVAGATVAVVYVVTTTILAEVAGVRFGLALGIGFGVGVLTHFTLQRYFVWRSAQGFALALHHQLARYLLVAAVQYVVTLVGTNALTDLSGVRRALVYPFVVLVVTVTNFVIFRRKVFHPGVET